MNVNNLFKKNKKLFILNSVQIFTQRVFIFTYDMLTRAFELRINIFTHYLIKFVIIYYGDYICFSDGWSATYEHVNVTHKKSGIEIE